MFGFLRKAIFPLTVISLCCLKSVATEIKPVDGTPVLIFNGREVPFIVCREHVSYNDDKQEYLKKVNAAGIKTYWLAWTVPFVEKKGAVLTANHKTLASRIRGILRAGEDSRIILQLRTTIKTRSFAGWCESNPDHVAVWPPEMKKGDRVTAVSDKVVPIQKQSLTWLGEFLASLPYADRIAGVIIAGGNGEWMDYWDYSKAAQDDFRKWIYRRYSGDTAKLREAWSRPDIDFEKVSIPKWEKVLSQGDVGIFFDPAKNQPLIDFMIYHRTRLGDLAIDFARAFRKGAKDVFPVGMWGGGYQPGSPSKNLYYGFGKGRNPSASLISAPEFDFFINPYNYRERHPGGIFYQPVSSFALYGKMILCEEDTRTYITPKYKKYASWEKLGDNFGQAKTEEETVNVLKRNFAGVFTHPGAGISYFSLGGGFWFNSDRIINTFEQFCEIAKNAFRQNSSSAEVALILNSDSTSYQCMNNFIQLFSRQAIELARTGTPLDIYHLKDLDAENFPFDKYKVFVFCDMARIEDKEAETIEKKLKRDDKTLVWFYAPGFVGQKELSIERSSRLTGIKLNTAGSELSLDFGMSIYFTDYNSKSLDGVPKGTRVWTELPVYPVVWAEDDDATVIAEALASDRQIATYRKPGVCIKKFDNWTSVWAAVPIMPASVLGNIFREAGVHIYSKDGAQVFAGQGIFALQASLSGSHRICFPEEYKIYDPIKNEEVQLNGKEIVVDLKKGDTVMWNYHK